jgi:hypothetical protein
VKELKMAVAARHPDDPADEPGLHLQQARSFNEAQPLDEATAVMWFAQDRCESPTLIFQKSLPMLPK